MEVELIESLHDQEEITELAQSEELPQVENLPENQPAHTITSLINDNRTFNTQINVSSPPLELSILTKLLTAHHKKIETLALIRTIILALILIGVGILIYKAHKIQKLLENASITTVREVYKHNEDLKFFLEFDGDIDEVTFDYYQHVFAGEGADYIDNGLLIKPKIIDPETGKEYPVSLTVDKEKEGRYVITGTDLENILIPGKYQLQVDLRKGLAKETKTQDFSWGVLAVNTNKSVYTPGDEAKIYLAVLDDFGEMVCNADVELEITDPKGEKTLLSTGNQSIIVNPGCKIKAVIPEADYETSYIVEEIGEYEIKIKATTGNGTYEITDQFSVQESIPFDIERITATRIYPVKDYPVILKVVPYMDFTGQVREIIPDKFGVVSTNNKLVELFTNKNDLEYQEPVSVYEESSLKILTWEVNWQKGQEYYLAYSYNAPDRSPDFYTIGPLSVLEPALETEHAQTESIEIFSEYRQWQIAVDILPAFRMEIQTITDANTGWATYTFDNEYASPVVIVTVEPNSSWATNDPPFSVNIRNVDGTGADVRVTIPDRNFGTGAMPDNNTVYMLVVEEGYNDGTSDSSLTFKIEAQKFDSSGVCSNTYGSIGSCTVSRSLDAGWGSTAHHYFSNASLDNQDTWIETAQWGSTSNGTPPGTTQTSGILVGLSSAEVTTEDSHSTEEIHFVVIEDGTHSFDSQSFRADRTPVDVRHYDIAANADAHTFGTTPSWGIDDLQAMDGSDGAWANWQISPFDADNVIPYSQEDRYLGSDETTHMNEEHDWFIANTGDWDYEQALGLTQAHYHWRKDNGSEATATSATSGNEDTNIIDVEKGDTKRIRMSVTNLSTGSDSSSYRIEYGVKSTNCSAIGSWTDVGAGGGDWDMSDSAYLFDGSNSTNIAISIGGVTDENDTFETPNNAVKDTSSTTSSITLSTTEFVEIEYSIKANPAATAGSTYCFRVTDSGTPIDNYIFYPEATIKTETMVIGEIGQATTDYQGTNIQFNNRYEYPVVIAETITGDDTGGSTNRPAAAMITYVDGTGFNVRIQETDSENDDHGNETFGWMVMEEGSWTLQDGTQVDAGVESLTSSEYWNGGSAHDCNFTQSFTSAPVVISALQTNNNTGSVDFLHTIALSTTTSDFECYMVIEDGGSGTPTTGEDFGWIAFDLGTGTVNDLGFEASDTGINVTGWADTPWHSQPFSQSFSSAPILLATRNAGNGPDEGWIRYDDLTSSSVDLAIDENDDSDRSHTTTDGTFYIAFESSGDLLAQIELEQAAYRWFYNSDSLNVGNTRAAQDVAASLDTNTDIARLRLLVDVDTSILRRYGKNLKLQYAEKSGTCDIGFSGETYLDVGTTTAIAYYNNPTPADGQNLTDNTNDPSHGGETVVNQTYEEINNFSNDVSEVATNEDALWDFSLYDYNAPVDTTYCFRIVDENDEVLSTYSIIPELTAVGINISGTAYTDDNEIVTLDGVDICTAVDSTFDISDCDTTSSGVFNIINVPAVDGGEQLSLFVEGDTNGNVITVGNTSDITSVVLYQDHTLTRYETGSNLSIIDMDAYDNDQNPADMLFDAENDSPDTLTWESGTELYVPSGYTFTPGGNTNGHDIEIDGVWTASSGETIDIDGTFKLDTGGTFNPSTSTLTLDAASGTEDLITDGTGEIYNLVIDDGGGGSLVVEVEDPLIVQNNLTITNGTLDVKTENNQINVGGNWTNDDIFEARNGTVVFDGATNATLDSGCADEDTCTNENFYNLTINKAKDAAVTLSNTHLRVTNLLNVITGWLIQAAQNIRSEGSTAIDIDDFGRWSNTSTGDITLGGDVLNDGNITLNANGMSCGDSDSITIASTNTTSRSWSGQGAFRITDVSVSYQTGSATVYAASSTSLGNMEANWYFVDCNEFLFEGVNFDNLEIN